MIIAAAVPALLAAPAAAAAASQPSLDDARATPAAPDAAASSAAASSAAASGRADAATASSAPGTERPDDASVDSRSAFDEPPPPLRKVGLMFDLGTMEGGMMSLVYRPAPWLRLHGGAGTNGASPGVKLGAVLAPWRDTGWSFSLDGGHFFPGNVNGVFAAFAGSDYDDSHLLERFDYDFVTLQLGWEIERGDLMFFARGGIGLLWSQLPSDDLGRIDNLSSFVDPTDGSVQALLPTLSLGIIGFL